MVPEIDSEIGIRCYSTDFAGTGGRIRESREDFRVSEVLLPGALDSIVETGAYPVYELTKSGIDTRHALSGVSKRTGLRLRALGLKDANAVTTQYAYSSSRRAGPEEFAASRYSIRRLGYTDRPLSKGDMSGNRFSIRVSGGSPAMASFDEAHRLLNFYGYQRFGSSRPVTHRIGKAVVQGHYGEAVRYILSFASKYDSEENAVIRRELSDPSNFRQAYGRIPPQMDLERRIVSEMLKHGDALRAIRALPVEMRRFYIQAYQSYLFNLTLSSAASYGEELLEAREGDVCYGRDGALRRYDGGPGQRLAVPTVGHAYYKKTRFHFYISKILEDEGVSPGDFYVRQMQESSSEGGFRNSAIGVDGFEVSGDWVSFTLSRGSFATIVMREVLKPADPLASGF